MSPASAGGSFGCILLATFATFAALILGGLAWLAVRYG